MVDLLNYSRFLNLSALMVTLSPEDLALLNQMQNAQPGQGNALPAPSPEDLAALQPPALYQQPAIDPRTQQMDQAFLDQVATPPAATQAPNQDPSQAPAPALQPGDLMTDPSNGLTSNAPQQVQATGADGQPLVLPANSGASNAYAGQQPSPQQDQQGGGESAKPSKNFWNWYKETYGVKPGDQVDASHVQKLQQIYAETTLKAKEIPPPMVRTVNGHTYLFAGNNTPINADQKENPTSMAQLQDGTLGRVDNVTGKFTPVTDAQGNIMKGALKGNDAMMEQLSQMGQQPPKPAATPGSHWWNLGAKPSPTPSAVPGPTPYNPSPSASASPTPSAQPPVVTTPDDYAKIPAGAQFVFNGKVLTKRGQ